MPKKRMLRVEPWPPYDREAQYLLKVVSVDWSESGKALVVKLVHLAESQAGRGVEALLPLPLRPEGLTTGFLRAAGLEVIVNGKLDPTGARDATVLARFEPKPDGEGAPVEFLTPKEATE